MPLELIVDSFAGGGGASTGIRSALGRDPDHAVNHDPIALAIHEANHPGSKHWATDLQGLHPLTVTGGRPVGLLWASPDCTDHSKAKGGVPRRKTIRDLAWVVVLWAKTAKPRVIILENVEEFRQWGPLLADGRPDPAARGQEFDRWVEALRAAGYRVEWRELRACDYGTPTTRKRLFLIARRDRQPIVWPEPTHGPGKLPYRTAAECIDWSIPVRSIFDRSRPLAPATCRRIARGVKRYVLDAARLFLVPYYGGDQRVHGVDDPLRTQTTENRFALITPFLMKLAQNSIGHGLTEPFHTVLAGATRFALITPFLMTNTSGHAGRAMDEQVPTVTTGGHHALVAPVIVGCGGRAGQSRPRGVDEPMATTTSKADACVVTPFLAPRYGERPGQDPRCLPVDAPMPTVVPTGNGGSLVAAFMAQHNGGCTGHDATEPVSTVLSRGSHQGLVAANLLHLRNNCDGRPVEAPLPTVTAGGGHVGDVRCNLSIGPDFGRAQQVAAFLSAYYGTDQAGNLEAPLATATTVDRFAVVTVTIEGVEYVLTDIGMRMLEPVELYRAQGFPSDYVIAPVYQGKPLSKTAQVRACGNSVCPPIAEALVRANVVLRDVAEPAPVGGLFAEVV